MGSRPEPLPGSGAWAAAALLSVEGLGDEEHATEGKDKCTGDDGSHWTCPDGRVLIAGGTDGTTPLASAELYERVTGTFTENQPVETAASAP